MKKIWIATAVLLTATSAGVKAQTDTTYKKSDTTITRSDTTYGRSDTTVRKSTNVNTVSSTSTYSHSDMTDKGGVRLGIRAGVNSSNVIKSGSGDVDFSTGAKLGFNAAAFLEIPLITGFSIQPELQFSQKGYKSTGNYLSTPYEYQLTSNYVEVPLLAKFKPSKNFGILVGPQFSFLSSTKTKWTVNNSSYENIAKQDFNNLRKNILGGVIGLEAMGGPIVFDLRYNIDFQKNNGDGTSSIPPYKNQVFSLSAGFRF